MAQISLRKYLGHLLEGVKKYIDTTIISIPDAEITELFNSVFK